MRIRLTGATGYIGQAGPAHSRARRSGGGTLPVPRALPGPGCGILWLDCVRVVCRAGDSVPGKFLLELALAVNIGFAFGDETSCENGTANMLLWAGKARYPLRVICALV